MTFASKQLLWSTPHELAGSVAAVGCGACLAWWKVRVRLRLRVGLRLGSGSGLGLGLG